MVAEREKADLEVPRSSVAERGHQPGEVTVRFNRWSAWGQTAYQKGQFAGFLRPEAEKIVAAGRGIIVEGDVARAPVPRAPRKFGGG